MCAPGVLFLLHPPSPGGRLAPKGDLVPGPKGGSLGTYQPATRPDR